MDGFLRDKRDRMASIAAQCRDDLVNHVAPYWADRVIDREHGGFHTCFAKDGTLYDARHPGWFMGRTMYMFSALYHEFDRNPRWLDVARAGYQSMPLYQLPDGRFAQMLTADGRVENGAISIFTDHFAVKGLINYLAALGHDAPKAEIDRARQMLDKLLEDVQKPDVLRTVCADERFMTHAVTFMNIAVLLESTKLFGDAYSSVLQENVFRSMYAFASDEWNAPLEHVGYDGHPIAEGPGRLVDAGHTMESVWFAMEAAQLLGLPQLTQRASQVLDWVIDRCWDGEYGGFVQHVDAFEPVPEEPYLYTDYNGVPVGWQDKIWWVQAEGLIALLSSALHTHNPAHWQLFETLYDYVRARFVDPQTREWYSFLHRDGSMLFDAPGSMSKGPYHVPRCLMMLCTLLEKALQA